MGSVLIIAATVIGGFFLSALAVWASVRIGRSSKATLLRAIGFTLVLALLNGVLSLGVLLVPAGPIAIAAQVLTLCLQIWICVMFAGRFLGLRGWKRLYPLASQIALLLPSLAFALLIVKPHWVEAFVIPTDSMAPTLLPGTRFFCNKLLTPRRGDVVAVRAAPQGQTEIWCKRIIGLPGERVRIEGGKLFINDREVALPSSMRGALRATAGPADLRYRIGRYQEGETIQLGGDEWFFLGDNLERSGDSRTIGPAKTRDIVGVGDLIYWPLSKAAILR